jgi:hypothetical protein
MTTTEGYSGGENVPDRVKNNREHTLVRVPDTSGRFSRGLFSCAQFRAQRTTEQG